MRVFLDQDRRVVVQQREGLVHEPKLMLINDADTQARWWMRVKDAFVKAQADGKPALFVVDPKASGVTMKTFRTIDNLRAADIAFKGVEVPADALLGDAPGGNAAEVAEEAMDFATVLLCCEAVGIMKFTNDTTLDYLKTRKQFGVTIGSFQALQHRMVDMTVNARQSESICMLAASRLDSASRGEISADERRRVVSACKIKVSESCRHIGQEAIQLHGGMGMTEELKVSHAFKRLTMIAQQFGDVDHHLERFARTPEQASAGSQQAKATAAA